MAPVPEDNQDKAPNRKDDDLSSVANPHQPTAVDIGDSSDDSEDEGASPSGYTLLPQDPDDCNDSDGELEESDDVDPNGFQDNSDIAIAQNTLPEMVHSSEAGAVAPTVLANQGSYHPEFLAKFPDGKIPSYMQVPNLSSDNGDQLWNEKRKPSDNEVLLNSAHDRDILKAMAGFSLPTENIPEWAKTVPEDEFHKQVTHHIRADRVSAQHSLRESSTDSSTHVWPGKCVKDTKCDNDSDDWVACFDDAN